MTQPLTSSESQIPVEAQAMTQSSQATERCTPGVENSKTSQLQLALACQCFEHGSLWSQAKTRINFTSLSSVSKVFRQSLRMVLASLLLPQSPPAGLRDIFRRCTPLMISSLSSSKTRSITLSVTVPTTRGSSMIFLIRSSLRRSEENTSEL